MNSKEISQEDDPNEWPPYHYPPATRLGQGSESGDGAALGPYEAPRGLHAAQPSMASSASASESGGGTGGKPSEDHALPAEGAASGRYRRPPTRRSPPATPVGSDWMAGVDVDHEAPANAPEMAPDDATPDTGCAQAAPDEKSTPAAPCGRQLKRSYGRAMAPMAAAPTLLPLAHELDMFPPFMSRSALFSAIRSNSGGSHAGPLKASGKVSLALQGPRLSMADKRVWQALVRLAKRGRVDVAGPFDIALTEVAEMAGFGRGQTRSAWEAIERLAASKVDAVVDGVAVNGWLLASAKKDRRRRSVAFDAAFIEAALARVLNVELVGSPRGRSQPPLAQWLGDYFLSHEPSDKAPDLNYLRGLCGYGGAPKDFAAALEEAMDALAGSRPDLIEGWSIDKSKRSSLNWTLAARRGGYCPRAKHPPKLKAVPVPTPASLAMAAAAARRRGPAL